jgi:hypothetical protein
MALKGVQSTLRDSHDSRPYFLTPSAAKTLREILIRVQNETIPLDPVDIPDGRGGQPPHDALLVLLPLLIVLSTFLFILLFFLVCVILIRRRRGIVLRDRDGPVDMSREELIDGEGGFEGIESRWMESVNETVRRAYLRAKGMCLSDTYLYHPSFDLFCNRLPAALSSKLTAN